MTNEHEGETYEERVERVFDAFCTEMVALTKQTLEDGREPGRSPGDSFSWDGKSMWWFIGDFGVLHIKIENYVGSKESSSHEGYNDDESYLPSEQCLDQRLDCSTERREAA